MSVIIFLARQLKDSLRYAILPLNEAIVCVISNGFKQQPPQPTSKAHTHTPWREREREEEGVGEGGREKTLTKQLL